MTLSLEIVAHRGYSAVAPENTLAALERALEAGADAVEFDLHVASCGTPVLIHDAALGRTTNGFGPVRRRTLAQLQALDAGSWFAPEFAGESIPTLAAALARMKGRVGRIYAEVKGYRELEDLDRIVRLARDADLSYDTVFISLDWGVLERIADQDDLAGIGYVVDSPERWEEAVRRASPDRRALISVDHRIVLESPELVRRARQRNVETAVWTVNDPEEAEALARAGVTRFTTDQVTRLLEWREARGD